jgi:hypothetical protein
LRIPLDEGVPRIIQKRLSQLSISNVEEMGWRGIKNGALLDLMAGQFPNPDNYRQAPSRSKESQAASNLTSHSSNQRCSIRHWASASD